MSHECYNRQQQRGRQTADDPREYDHGDDDDDMIILRRFGAAIVAGDAGGSFKSVFASSGRFCAKAATTAASSLDKE